MDTLDNIRARWAEQLPELDTQSMGIIGRLQLIHKHMAMTMSQTFRRFNLTDAGFDVLATLYRCGPDRAQTASELGSHLLVTSGSLTSRLDSLERQQLVKRTTDKNDRRRHLVQLTPSGAELLERVINAHVETQKELLAPFSTEEQLQLESLLRRYLERIGK